MEIFLVTASDYDFSLIDSAWATREEAEERILDAQTTPHGKGLEITGHAESLRVTVMTLGEIRPLETRYRL